MGFEQPPSPKEKLLQETLQIVDGYLKSRVEKASDTDSIFGTISGRVKSTPSSFFEISFDTDKNNLELTVQNLLAGEFDNISLDYDSQFEFLSTNIGISSEPEKGKPVEERTKIGSIKTFIRNGILL